MMRRTGGWAKSLGLSLCVTSQGVGTPPALLSSRVREIYRPSQAFDTPDVKNAVISDIGLSGLFQVTSPLRCEVNTNQLTNSEIGDFLKEIKKDDGSPALSPEQIRDTVEKLEKQEIVTLEDLNRLVTEEKMERWGIPGRTAAIIYAELQKASVPVFDPKNYKFKTYLDSQINNKDDVNLFERNDQVQQIKSQFAGRGDAKPVAVTLFSGRGSGKTSFLRQVALSSSTLDARECGRVLVRDLAQASYFNELKPLKVPARSILTALVVHHLCTIFAGTQVGGIPFNTGITVTQLVSLLNRIENPDEKINGWPAQFLDWFKKVQVGSDSLYSEWERLTSLAFGPSAKGHPLILCDSVEALASSAPKGPFHKENSQKQYTYLECLMTSLPSKRVGVYVGTQGSGVRHELFQTQCAEKRLTPLPGLGEDSSRQLFDGIAPVEKVKPSKGETETTRNKLDRFFKVVFSMSSGVPRLLVLAAQEPPANPKADVSTWLTNWKKEVDNYYHGNPDPTKSVDSKSLAALALSCAVGSKTPRGSQVALQAKPPKAKLTWGEYQYGAIAFLMNDRNGGHQWTIPQVLWQGASLPIKQKVESEALKLAKIDINDLFPSIESLYEETTGDTGKGKVWEKMFCSALVARYHVLCWESDVVPGPKHFESMERLLGLPPNSHKLQDLEASFCDGIIVSKNTEATVRSEYQPGILANWNVSGAHHDFIVGVRNKSKNMSKGRSFSHVTNDASQVRKSSRHSRVVQNSSLNTRKSPAVGVADTKSDTGSTENWAGSAKAGYPKHEKELEETKQLYYSKKCAETDEHLVPGLIQACRYDNVVKQRFAENSTLSKLEMANRFHLVDIQQVMPQYSPVFHAYRGTSKPTAAPASVPAEKPKPAAAKSAAPAPAKKAAAKKSAPSPKQKKAAAAKPKPKPTRKVAFLPRNV